MLGRRKTGGTRMSKSIAKRTGGLLLLAALACSAEKAAGPKACCDQPKIPAGVTPFVVVGDDVNGPSDGQKVIMRVGVSQPIKRDQVYPILHTLYRHAMTRNAFEPIQFVANVYASETAARAGGDSALVGRIVREQSDLGPKCENKIPYDMGEQVARAFAVSIGRGEEEDSNDSCHLAEKKAVARIDDKFTHRPSYKFDPARAAVEVSYPYLELGRDEYVKDLKYSSAMRDWIEHAQVFFGKVEGLKELTFVGVKDDQPVIKITVTRQQFDSQLASLQEEIAAHSAVTFASLGMHTTNDKGAAKEQSTFQNKTYKTALAQLPKNQVFVSPKLK
jgi:hypothetical protein